MSVPLGRSPPVLRAGVRFAKPELAWRFGPSGCVGAVPHSWRQAFLASGRAADGGERGERRARGGGGGGGGGGERIFYPPGCYLLRRDGMSRHGIRRKYAGLVAVPRKMNTAAKEVYYDGSKLSPTGKTGKLFQFASLSAPPPPLEQQCWVCLGYVAASGVRMRYSMQCLVAAKATTRSLVAAKATTRFRSPSASSAMRITSPHPCRRRRVVD
jgi:hypothetical protein